MSKRRKFLNLAVAGMAGFGVISYLTPFSKSWNIRKGREKDFDVDVDISRLEEGQLIRTEWMGKPIHIYRRTPADMESLDSYVSALQDPESEQSIQPEAAKNKYRSIDPDIFLAVPLCTHLGCEATHKPDVGSHYLSEGEWLGGYFCPCHGSTFDSAGRVYKGMPAPVNFEVPPYKLKDGKVFISLAYEV